MSAKKQPERFIVQYYVLVGHWRRSTNCLGPYTSREEAEHSIAKHGSDGFKYRIRPFVGRKKRGKK
jgi:hypothetical protein